MYQFSMSAHQDQVSEEEKLFVHEMCDIGPLVIRYSVNI